MAKSKTPIRRDQEITFEVKFLDDCDPADGSAMFKAGKVYELIATSANRWIRRGKAVRHVSKPKPVTAKAPKAPPKKRVYTRKATTPKKVAPTPKPTVVIPEEKKMPDGSSSSGIPTTDW